MRFIFLMAGLAAAVTVLAAATKPQAPPAALKKHPQVAASRVETCRSARQAIPWYRRATVSWQRRREAGRLAGPSPLTTGHSCGFIRWAAHEWQARAVKAHVRYLSWQKQRAALVVGHTAMWICIHNREGDWNDHGAPYYGGLQMGWGFMNSYGSSLLRSKGTADNWTANEQMSVAEAAYRSNGYSRSWLYSQWPNTAPPCT